MMTPIDIAKIAVRELSRAEAILSSEHPEACAAVKDRVAHVYMCLNEIIDSQLTPE